MVVKYEVFVSKIEYGSAIVEADSEEEARKKAFNEEVEIFYHDYEISDVTISGKVVVYES